MSIFDFFKGKPKALGDKPKQTNPEVEALLSIMKMMGNMNENGITSDQFPDGVGEFGHSVDNPIPCDTIIGSNSYLSQLRWSGHPVTNNRIGSFGSEIIEHPIDGYRISSSDGKELATIYISPYQKKNSSLAPRGFTLAG